MEIAIIENPKKEQCEPIIQGVLEYGLSQIGGQKPKDTAFHVTNDTQLIGGATARKHFSQFYLDNLWIDREHRSLGIGKKLHQEILQYALKLESKRILLNTLNSRAVSFYKSLGYEEIAVIEG